MVNCGKREARVFNSVLKYSLYDHKRGDVLIITVESCSKISHPGQLFLLHFWLRNVTLTGPLSTKGTGGKLYWTSIPVLLSTKGTGEKLYWTSIPVLLVAIQHQNWGKPWLYEPHHAGTRQSWCLITLFKAYS